MGWFRSGHNKLDGPWRGIDWKSTFGVDRSQHTDVVWLNLDAGATIALVSDGEWRRPHDSRFRLFYRRFNEVPVELTEAILWEAERGGHYDPDETGASVYSGVESSCVSVVDRILGIDPDTRGRSNA